MRHGPPAGAERNMTDTAMGKDGDLALGVHLEPLLEGRRVLVLGALGDNVRARLTQAVEELENVGPEGLGEELELPYPRGAFDLVWLLDAGLVNPTPDALFELKRVLTHDGVLVVCRTVDKGPKRTRGPGPEVGLARVLEREFRELRLLRQASVHAQGFEEIDTKPRAVVVDTSLVRSEPVQFERVVAIASDDDLKVDSRLWVQLPGPVHLHDDALEERLHEAQDRAHTLSLTLDAAEADLEDSFARVRWLESQIAEKDAAAAHEREARLKAERQLEHGKTELEGLKGKLSAAQAERDAARADVEAARAETAEIEERLAERGAHIQSLEHDIKRSETAARDLLEELRRIEHERSTAAEQDGRIAELEGDVARAAARALEAEVAREAALMRVDELRAKVQKLEAQPVSTGVDAALEGTLFGLRMRLRELEQTLKDAERAEARREEARDVERGEITGLTLRLAEAERALAARPLTQPREESDERDVRIASLERELEEADRFAEAHADDVERIESLEAELTRLQRRYDDLEDDLRATQDDLQAARAEIEHIAVESSARVELAQKREVEARSERDHARAALEEARGILAQLTGKVANDIRDPSIS